MSIPVRIPESRQGTDPWRQQVDSGDAAAVRARVPLPNQGQAGPLGPADRPVRSARGWSAAPVRHGVSAIRSGQRHTLALVFRDAA
jgi:hypothetical protein